MKKIIIVFLVVFVAAFMLQPSKAVDYPQSNHVEVIDFDDDQSPDFENM